MKHITTFGSSEIYYYNKWKSNAHGALIAITLTMVCIIWAVVAGAVYGSVGWCVSLACSAVFWGFLSIIRLNDTDYYYARYQSATTSRSIINYDHICE